MNPLGRVCRNWRPRAPISVNTVSVQRLIVGPRSIENASALAGQIRHLGNLCERDRTEPRSLVFAFPRPDIAPVGFHGVFSAIIHTDVNGLPHGSSPMGKRWVGWRLPTNPPTHRYPVYAFVLSALAARA